MNHLTPEFIQDRKLSLCTFLNRLAEHPVLTFDECLKLFLTASSEVSIQINACIDVYT